MNDNERLSFLDGLLYPRAFVAKRDSVLANSLCFQPCGCDLLMVMHVVRRPTPCLARRGEQLTLSTSLFSISPLIRGRGAHGEPYSRESVALTCRERLK